MTVEKDSPFTRILQVFKAKTATEVADKLGISPQAVSKWNKDGGMKFSTLVLISDQTGVLIHWLLTGKGEKYVTAGVTNVTKSIASETDSVDTADGEWTLFSSLVDGRLHIRLQRGDVEVSYTIASMTHEFTK